jgi:hypothetical protein
VRRDLTARWLPRLAATLWAVAVVVVCVRSAAGGRVNSVYQIFAEAGRDWAAGRDPYEFHAGEASGPYRYSPPVSAGLVPFGLLPDEVGGVAWRLGCAALMLGGLVWWSRVLLRDGPAWRAGLVLLVLPLAVGNLNNGQSNPLVLGLLLVAAAALTHDRESNRRWSVLAGACLAGAVLLKGYPLAAALLMVVAASRRRVAVWFVLALAAGLLLPFLLHHRDYVAAQYAHWWEHLRTSDRTEGPRVVWYRDLRLLLANLGLPLSGWGYLAVQLSSAALMTALCHWRRRSDLALGLGACWMTVFGSAAESATYLLLAPTAAWSLLDSWRRQRPWPVRMVLLGGYLLLVASQLAAWFPNAKEVHALGVQPLAGLLVFVGVVAAELGADTPGRRGLQYSHRLPTSLG